MRAKTQIDALPSRRQVVGALAAASALPLLARETAPEIRRKVYLVPNFHPASCGWLTTFSKERVYCANSYLDHLDRVRDDPAYEFVLSEVNNVIAIMNFRPERTPELRARIQQGRVEIVNGYFLESAINLSGGEALAKLGIEGLRWFQQKFGVKPRFSWNIDVCGTHDQMPQIASALGFDALVYTRKNPTGKTMFWSASPDGSKILTLCPGHYSEAPSIFKTREPLSPAELAGLEGQFAKKEPITPANAPLLVLAGADDYALAPLYKKYPAEFLEQWRRDEPGREVVFATLGKYLDAILPGIRSGEIDIPTVTGGTAYDFDAFWIENPKVKTWFRRNEHALQAAEIVATVASLHGDYEYPSETLHNAWILTCLNMDRNTVWGSAGGMVFEDAQSWDVRDRLTWVENAAQNSTGQASTAMVEAGEDAALFNCLNWDRHDPVVLKLPAGRSVNGAECEALPDGSILCQIQQRSVSMIPCSLAAFAPLQPSVIDFPQTITTKFYEVAIDRRSGALKSLRLRSSGRELLGGPANVAVAERPISKRANQDPGDFMPARPGRTRLGSSSEHNSSVAVQQGPVATTVDVRGPFYGGREIRRLMRFYHEHPRIDFETELHDVPNYTVVTVEFPLADDVRSVRRGIPFGFLHGAWTTPDSSLHGWTKGIVPAVRWIDFEMADDVGFALLDRGLSGRELDGRTPLLYLMNAEDKYLGYSNSWLSGRGKHVLHYAVVARDHRWAQSGIPQMAWEYNAPTLVMPGRARKTTSPAVETSGNLILEAMRREGSHIEMRLIECFGSAGPATVKLSLPHSGAWGTDLTGSRRTKLEATGGVYSFPVRAQQVITLHFETASSVPIPAAIESWDAFVPKQKLAALHQYDPTLIGHPPFGEGNAPAGA